jgi:hypothetical protein
MIDVAIISYVVLGSVAFAAVIVNTVKEWFGR